MSNYSSGYLDSKLSAPAISYDDAELSDILDDLQANILRHHAKTYSLYLLMTFKLKKADLSESLNKESNDGEPNILEEILVKRINNIKSKISEFAGEITFAKQQLKNRKECKIIRSFHMTGAGYAGLRILQIAPTESNAFLRGIDPAIISGLDKKIDAPANPTTHAMISISSDDFFDLENEKEKIKTSFDGLVKFREEYGFIKNDKKEWFGFLEGISQPTFFPTKNFLKKRGVLRIDNIDSLNLVLVEDPGGSAKNIHQEKASFGSYMTYLKLQQNVDNYHELIESQIDKENHTRKTELELRKSELENKENKSAADEEKLKETISSLTNKEYELNGRTKNSFRLKEAAKIIGRYPNGKPLTLVDSKNRKEAEEEIDFNDDFNYHKLKTYNSTGMRVTDESGLRCPFSAHIRKLNPRDGTYDYKAKKITRRSVLYASNASSTNPALKDTIENIVEGLHDGGKEKGILFMSFQRNIEKQFEGMMKNMLSTHATNGRIAVGKDELLRKRKDGKSLVTYIEGIYFFTPSISFLKSFAVDFIPRENNAEIPEPRIDNLPNFANGKIKPGVIQMKPMYFGDQRDEIIEEILREK